MRETAPRPSVPSNCGARTGGAETFLPTPVRVMAPLMPIVTSRGLRLWKLAQFERTPFGQTRQIGLSGWPLARFSGGSDLPWKRVQPSQICESPGIEHGLNRKPEPGSITWT